MKRLFFLVLLFTTLFAHSQTTVNLSSYVTYTDSVADYGVQLQNAFKAGGGSPVILVFNQGVKTYRSSIRLNIPSNVTIKFNGCTLKPYAPYTPSSISTGFLYNTSAATYGRVTASSPYLKVTKGSKKFRFANASSLVVGRIIFIDGPTFWTTGDSYKDGLYDRVTAIVGDSVTVEHPAQRTFQGLGITQYGLSQNIHIDGLILNMKGAKLGTGISLTNTLNSSVQHTKVFSTAAADNTLNQGIFVSGVNILCNQDSVWDIKTHATTYTSTIPSSGAVGYGINVGGHDITIQNSWAKSTKHQILCGGRTYWSSNIRILNNVMVQGSGTQGQVDFHGMAWGTIKGNRLEAHPPNTLPMNIRSDSSVVENNNIIYDNRVGTLTGSAINLITFSEMSGRDILVKGNRVQLISPVGTTSWGLRNSTSQPYISSLVYGNYGVGLTNVQIVDNYFIGCGISIRGIIGAGFVIARNRIDMGTTFYTNTSYAAIHLQEANFKNGYDVSKNVFVNEASSGYAIRSDLNSSSSGGTVSYDTTYNKGGSTTAQIQLMATGFNANHNQLYANNTVVHISGTSGNTLSSNIKSAIPSTGVPVAGAGVWPKVYGNQAPIVNAGINQDITLTLGNTTTSVTLTATVTDDAAGVVTQWTKVSGTGSAISSPAALSTAVTALTAGQYTYRLTATDAGGLISSDDVTITVNSPVNMTPTVNAGLDQTLTLPDNSISLSAVASDPDGTVDVYAWTQVSGPVGTALFNHADAAVTDVTGLVQGVYVFRLTVTDDGGLKATDDVMITVKANTAPIANAGVDQTVITPTTEAILVGSGVDDVSISSYTWSYVSGPLGYTISTPTSSSTKITGLVLGTYIFRLTVVDGTGQTDTDDVTITVSDPLPNASPTATLTSPKQGDKFVPGSSITLAATASDPEGKIAKVEFFQGTALIATQYTSPYSYVWQNVASGTYSLTAKVTDDVGATGTSTAITIEVSTAPTVTLTSPTNGGRYRGSTGISVIAKASDLDGTITKVEFYNGTTLLNTDTIAPYSYNWVTTIKGSATLTAKAYDNSGNITISAPITIKVR